jgi:hypothetical protein
MTQIPTNCCNDKGSDITQKLLAAMDGILGNADKREKFINGTQEETVDLGGIDTDTLRRFKAKIDGILDGAIAQAETRMQELVDAAEKAAAYVDKGIEEFQSAVDFTWLSTQVKNIDRSFNVAEDLPAGSVITLPAPYFPKRNVLFIKWNGLDCIRKHPDESPQQANAPEFEEVGDDIDTPSSAIRLLFPVKAGDTFHELVIMSNVGRNVDKIETAAAVAGEHIAEAAAFAELAAGYRDAAGQSATEAAESESQAKLAKDDARAFAVDAKSPLKIVRRDETLAATVAVGSVYPVPKYLPGTNSLLIFCSGLLCTPPDEYREVDGIEVSEKITLNMDVPAGVSMTALVLGAPGCSAQPGCIPVGWIGAETLCDDVGGCITVEELGAPRDCKSAAGSTSVGELACCCG